MEEAPPSQYLMEQVVVQQVLCLQDLQTEEQIVCTSTQRHLHLHLSLQHWRF
jgi:hypothetical protein